MATTLDTTDARVARRIARQQRSVELAVRDHLDGTARLIGTGEMGARLWQVPSRSSEGVHIVTHWLQTHEYTCTCDAHTYGRPCGHVGAAIKGELARAAAMRPSDRPSEGWQWWKNGGQW